MKALANQPLEWLAPILCCTRLATAGFVSPRARVSSNVRRANAVEAQSRHSLLCEVRSWFYL